MSGNPPIKSVTLDQLNKMHVNIDLNRSLAYVFVGPTPSAQLEVALPDDLPTQLQLTRQFMRMFPEAFVSFTHE